MKRKPPITQQAIERLKGLQKGFYDTQTADWDDIDIIEWYESMLSSIFFHLRPLLNPTNNQSPRQNPEASNGHTLSPLPLPMSAPTTVQQHLSTPLWLEDVLRINDGEREAQRDVSSPPLTPW